MKSFRTLNFSFIDFTEMDENLSREVWKCRNMTEIRKFMTDSNPICYESHNYFVKSLDSQDKVCYYCVLMNEQFIGSVNIHFINSQTVERGIYIHPMFWGKGLSKLISSEFYSYLYFHKGIKTIVTKVMKNNKASNSLQYSLGGKLLKEDDIYYYYELKLGPDLLRVYE